MKGGSNPPASRPCPALPTSPLNLPNSSLPPTKLQSAHTHTHTWSRSPRRLPLSETAWRASARVVASLLTACAAARLRDWSRHWLSSCAACPSASLNSLQPACTQSDRLIHQACKSIGRGSQGWMQFTREALSGIPLDGPGHFVNSLSPTNSTIHDVANGLWLQRSICRQCCRARILSLNSQHALRCRCCRQAGMHLRHPHE